MKKWLKQYWPLLFLLTFATILRVIYLFTRGEIWFDEWFSIHFSTLETWKKVWHYLTMESNPVFYNLFLRTWLKIVPNTVNWTRLPSLIFAAGGLTLMYLWAQKMFNRKTAVWAGLLFSVSGLFIHLGTEVRSYSLLFLLSTTSLYLYYLLVTEINPKKIIWLGYFLVNAALLYTHLTATMLVLIQLICLILFQTNQEKIKKIFLLNVGAVLIWLTWAIPFALQRANGKVFSLWYFSTSGNFFKSFVLSFGAGLTDALPGIYLALWAMLWALLTYYLTKKFSTETQTHKINLIFLITLITLPIISASFLGVFVSKYYTVFYPAMFILFGYEIANFTTNTRRIILVLILWLILITPGIYITYRYPYINYRLIAQTVNTAKRPDTKFLVDFTEKPTLEYSQKMEVPVIAVDMNTTTNDYDEKVVRYNSLKRETTEDELRAWVYEKIGNSQHVFILELMDNLDWIKQILQKDNWIVIKKTWPQSRWAHQLYELEKTDVNTLTTSTKK